MSNPVQPLTPEQTAQQDAKTDSNSYVHRSFVALDDLANVLADGSPDETISSRMARWAVEDHALKHDIGVAACKALNLIQQNHGALAMEADAERGRDVTKIEDEAESTLGKKGQP